MSAGIHKNTEILFGIADVVRSGLDFFFYSVGFVQFVASLLAWLAIIRRQSFCLSPILLRVAATLLSASSSAIARSQLAVSVFFLLCSISSYICFSIFFCCVYPFLLCFLSRFDCFCLPRAF